MKKFLLNEHPEFDSLLNIVDARLKIGDPYLVEKDYWIMNALYFIEQAGFSFQLKGGTSLSKGWNLIDRFSEDIDIRIEPESVNAIDFKVYTNKNHDKKDKHIKSRKMFYDKLSKILDQKIPNMSSERDETFDDKKKYRNGGIRLYYETVVDKIDPKIKNGILLEVGFDQTTPCTSKTITSWAYEHVSKTGNYIDNRAINVACYNPEYTFVEKLQTIARKYRKYKEGKEFPINFIRHYYDVFKLINFENVIQFCSTKEYKTHKAKRFSENDLDILHVALCLKDAADRKLFEEKYNETSSLYYHEKPNFSEIISKIETIIDIL